MRLRGNLVASCSRSEDGRGERLIWCVVGSSKMIATFTNTLNNQLVELLVRGDWFDRSATITMGNAVAATIRRSYFNIREIFGGQQTVSLACCWNPALWSDF